MTKREKILAAFVVGVLLLWGVKSLKTRFDDALAEKRATLNSTREQLGAAQLELERGREAVTKMETWQERSLPSGTMQAQQLYRTWLLERCKTAGLNVEQIEPDQRLSSSNAYSAIGYKITAVGTVKSLATLLFDFYRSRLLQQITR